MTTATDYGVAAGTVRTRRRGTPRLWPNATSTSAAKPDHSTACNRTSPEVRSAPGVTGITAISQERQAGAAGSGLARYRAVLRTPGALALPSRAWPAGCRWLCSASPW
jgi:hypothetical protein